MKKQPVPDVASEDVTRIVRRDFPESQFDMVMQVLGQYGTESWHREAARVQLAVLKLAKGSLDDLRKQVGAAGRDYRDALVAAEYPEYWREGSSRQKLADSERDRVVDSDWEQYKAWFGRDDLSTR